MHYALYMRTFILHLVLKLICLILGALGIANMWMAIFADVGVMVIAVLKCDPCTFCKEPLEK